MKLVFASLWCLLSVVYALDLTELDDCASDDSNSLNVSDLDKITLAAEEPSLPFIEGEHYSVQGSKAALQCKLPVLPSNTMLAITYTSVYVDNMRSLVVGYREKDADEGEEETANDVVDADECIIALFNNNFTEISLPEWFPDLCGSSRSVIYNQDEKPIGEITQIQDQKKSSKVEYEVNHSSRMLKLTFPNVTVDQAGTYQCIVFRNCLPAFNESRKKDDLPQEAVSFTKSLYLKAYPDPDYRGDMVIAAGSMAAFSGLLVVAEVVYRATSSVE